jgi:hypothetical protein
MAEKSKGTQTVIYSNYNDISPCETFAVKFHFRCVAPLKTAPEEPYKNGLALICGLGIGPYIKVETVFTHGYLGIYVPFTAVYIVSCTRGILYGYGRKLKAVPHAMPVFGGLRSSPAVLAYRRSGKWDAFE